MYRFVFGRHGPGPFFRTVVNSTGSLVDISGASQVSHLGKICDFSRHGVSHELADVWEQVGSDLYDACLEYRKTHGRPF